ncbi:GDP-mannose-dependent alpha-(1-6)-phosphatidylinositol monomannoside mannosyltransferase [Streptomyces viridochromogenes]|uniref:GDP-mannose-dependent alpha-(1-6)-phosphatidylinositol monomannoside mannosyltransferase n=1 Tax=Streptomyces viridochromogenes TaxID=1938 RepID=A0A0J7ZMF4_STRVR|nr:glycosyltransferase family 4 protein [Streptomyces viridochromogenes]KMS76562.1 GDP-mannose-dependent alpha-(1-6)-phosphatidylinositol monomannoside mannosyltransferase [Streptomyces viridochromogenes]KOG23340.1 GDP-mannose-dependent alpha-(1-6)-phosphatidylinositol monomannoside mannosyltransferase [Streptomyces viridochromogenes]KOG27054.1 GDP-mannose-dependent alpha-(1-6)-phosphatidylinositol monomannoside mannosyltransferase [Streptomyces viridochromogenes]
MTNNSRPRTLIVTNDFPPRQGGIETFVRELADRFPPDEVVVFTSTPDPATAESAPDESLPYPVIRHRVRTLLPTPRATAHAAAVARRYGCERVWFGAAAPLGLMAGRLRQTTGIRTAVATTHGHEVWWARTPGARALLRRIGTEVDALTWLGASTRRPIEAALTPGTRTARLVPGVDTTAFRPFLDGRPVRARYGLGRRPVILCAARLVPRKGQDTLIRALPWIRRAIPDAVLLLVGDGPYASELRQLALKEGVLESVVFAGGHPHHTLPTFYAAADVFAMPCRTRRRGLEVEGLGIVYLEAAASGLPVLAGDSGGAPDAVRDGETGHVVDGRSVAATADRLTRLLRNPELAREMGEKGHHWVRTEWSWDHSYATLTELLHSAGAAG